MGLLVDIPQSFDAVMCVDLSGGKTAVTEQFFYSIQFSSIIGEVGCKTMA